MDFKNRRHRQGMFPRSGNTRTLLISLKQTRLVPGSQEELLHCLNWAGLHFDEGESALLIIQRQSIKFCYLKDLEKAAFMDRMYR